MNINEHILKLTGKATLGSELELAHNYKVLIDGEITSVTDSHNQDGTADRIYKFEPILCEIKKDNGEVIKTKDTRSRSTMLRKVIYAIWMQNNSAMNSEDYYNKVMSLIIGNVEDFTNLIK